jgi:hypothetical protein
MPDEIRIYCEGHPLLRPGFAAFLQELRERGRAKRCKFQVITSGSGDAACRDFDSALKSHPRAWNILLIDREGPRVPNMSLSLCHEYKWNAAHANSIFWMVEMMEAWFHADKEKLKEYYGPDFRERALKPNPNIEEISKQDLKAGLSNATKNTIKGDYYNHKTSHAVALLGIIRSELVQAAAPHCKALFDAVLAGLAD